MAKIDNLNSLKDPENNWLKDEILRESQLTAWDLDGPGSLKRQKAIDQASKKLKSEHQHDEDVQQIRKQIKKPPVKKTEPDVVDIAIAIPIIIFIGIVICIFLTILSII